MGLDEFEFIYSTLIEAMVELETFEDSLPNVMEDIAKAIKLCEDVLEKEGLD